VTFDWKKTALALSLAGGLMATGPALTPAQAETPDNMLVQGMRIDDIITFDPAEVFELSTGEFIANIYDRVMMYEPEDLSTLVGGVVESWNFSEDGKTINFTMRPGQTFHSGNPVRPEDVVYSLQRVVILNKTPAFIFTQFGWSPENVGDLIKVTGDNSFSITITEDFSPGLVLNALSAGVASVVDQKLVEEHAVDGDMGYDWLKNKSAGSGPYSLVEWKANESVVLNAFDDYRHGKPAMQRVIIRHLPEPAAQRLLLEQGDIDMARSLTPDQIGGLVGNDTVKIEFYPKASLIYMAMNTTNEILSNPTVREALKYLIDYQGMAESFLDGQYIVHESFWPSGLWASADDKPYTLDVERAKELLAEAGYPDGFEIAIDSLNTSPYMEIAQSMQQTLSQAGITAEIIPQDGSALWPKYRARRHGLILARWSPDYVDPHSNADSFALNPDNREEAQLTGVLAWRNGWADPGINALAIAARNEANVDLRHDLYNALQRLHQRVSPFAIMFQQNEQVAMATNIEGFVSGSNFDLVFYRNVTK